MGRNRRFLTARHPSVTRDGVTPIVINVVGMTCEHCAKAVRTEISGLPGVTDVDVDVASGRVTVVADLVPDDAPTS
jgi:copper chaperone CopZ